MKVGILRIMHVAPEVVSGIKLGLAKAFPDTIVSIIDEILPIPQRTFDKKRNQYSSSAILTEVGGYAARNRKFDLVLGVVDEDIYVSGLNYVFGEAYTPGNAALISLRRLKPEFYGDKADLALYVLRALKEASHELGHTLGLQHCRRSMCVMHFSNSIFDTDKKQNLFCDQCYLQAAIAITNVGNEP